MSNYQRRHYDQLANAIFVAFGPPDELGYEARDIQKSLVQDLVTIFGDDNPNFQPDKFRKRVNGTK